MTNIYCDGAGTDDNKHGGKYCVYFGNDDFDTYRFSPEKKCYSNNEMEYMALIDALIKAENNDTIYSDSKLIVEQVNENYKVRADNLKILNHICLRLIESKNVTVKWIPRNKNYAGIILDNPDEKKWDYKNPYVGEKVY